MFKPKIGGDIISSIIKKHTSGRVRGSFRMPRNIGKMRKISTKFRPRRFSLSSVLPRRKF